MAKRRRPPLDMSLVSEEAIAFFKYYNEKFAPKYGWPRLPLAIGFWSYNSMLKLVEAWGEPWPTWPELEAGMEATAAWESGDGTAMSVNNPFWIVQAKAPGDDGERYPNVLLLKNFAIGGNSGGSGVREFEG